MNFTERDDDVDYYQPDSSLLQQHLPRDLIESMELKQRLLCEKIMTFSGLTAARSTLTDLEKIVDDLSCELLDQENRSVDESTADVLISEIHRVKLTAKVQFVLQLKLFLRMLADGGRDLILSSLFDEAVYHIDSKAVQRRYLDISVLLHPDKVRVYQDADLNEHASGLFSLFGDAKDYLLAALNPEAGGDPEATEANSIRSGRDYLSLSKDYEALEKLRVNAAPEQVLAACRRRIQQNPNLGQLLHVLNQITPEELCASKVKYARQAVDFFRAGIRAAELRLQSEETLHLRIEYRKLAAEAFFLGDCPLEATLYVLGAMNIANENVVDPRVILNDLYKLLRRIKGISSDVDETETNPVEEFSTLTVFNAKAAIQLRKQLQREYESWLTQAIFKADNSHVKVLSNEEQILEAKVRAGVYRSTGVAISVTGGLGMLYTVGTGLTAAVTAGGVALVAGPVMCLMGIACGVYMLKVGKDMSREPTIRDNLNNIMQRAMAFFAEGKMIEFLTSASEPYIDGRRLFMFEPGQSLEINSSEIINTLLKHAFRGDGIACLLNFIAEVLFSGIVRLTNKSPTELRYEGRKILLAIIDSEKLRNSVVKLDTDIFNSRTARSDRWVKWLRKKYSLFVDGIPTSYLEEAQVCPFESRLDEMKIIAKMNLLIVEIILNDENSEQNIKSHIEDLRHCVQTKFQYFSVGKYRTASLEDLMSAFGADPQPPPARPPTDSIRMIMPIHPNALKWGDALYLISNLKNVDRDMSFSTVLHSILGKPVLSTEDVRESIAKLISASRRNLYVSADDNMFRNDIEFDKLEKLERFRDGPLQDCLNRATPISVELLSGNHLDVLSMVFEVNFVRCCIFLTEHVFAPYSADDIARFDSQNPNYPTLFLVCKSDTECNTLFTIERTGFDMAGASNAVELQLQLAQGYISRASSEGDVRAISNWHNAKDCYETALGLCNSSWVFSTRKLVSTRTDHFFDLLPSQLRSATLPKVQVDAALGFALCLIKLSQFKFAQCFLNTIGGYDVLKEKAKYWYYCATTARRLNLMYDAAFALHKGLHVDPDHPDLLKEKTIIENMRAKKITEPLAVHFDNLSKAVTYSSYEEPKPKSYYDIISIDGGGVRGVVPAMWLAEIEKITRKPICQMAQMIAGTSTGAIIAGALSTKHSQRHYYPLKSAANLVEIYTNPGIIQRIFKPRFSLHGIFGSMYYEEGRRGVIADYVGPARLRDSLCDVALVATDLRFPGMAKVFTKQAALEKATENIFTVDALMASSAAPVYFPVYNVNGTNYADGGLVFNNPSQCALTEAARLFRRDKIRIWSLGTGDMAQSSNHIKTDQSILFWARRSLDYTMSPCEEYHLKEELSDRYQRWQVWMENPIGLDCTGENEMRYLIDLAEQFVEDNSDEILKCARSIGGDF